MRLETSWDAVVSKAFDTPLAEQVCVSKDPEFQRRGVDYRYLFPGHEVWVDDKSDGYQTGRAALEFVTANCWGGFTPGWLLSSQMAWLRYGFNKTGDVLLVPMAELRANFLPRLREFQPASAVNRHANSRAVRHVTFSSLVDVGILMDLCPGAVWLQLGYPDGSSFAGASMLPPQHARRMASAGQALERMSNQPGQCAPVEVQNLQSLWEFGKSKDRMAGWNAKAIAGLVAGREKVAA